VADAFAHCKFIGYAEAAMPLFEKAGIAGSKDKGMIVLNGSKDVKAFVDGIGELRIWEREPEMK